MRKRLGLDIRPDRDFSIVNPQNDPRYRDYWGTYHPIMARDGVTPDLAKAIMRTNNTAIAAVMVHRQEADSLICGTFGQYRWHLNYINQVLGQRHQQPHGALSLVILEDGPLFIGDTHIRSDPSPAANRRDGHWRGPTCPAFWIDPQHCNVRPFAIWQPAKRYRRPSAGRDCPVGRYGTWISPTREK